MAGDTENVWKVIEPRIDPDHFCASCHISSMNKKARSKNPLKPKVPLKWVFMDSIPATPSNSLTCETIFSNDILIIDTYSNILKFMVWRELLLNN